MKSTPRNRLLVFDLDGTLIDSRRDITTAVNLTMTYFGLEQLSEEIVGRHVGTGVGPLIEAQVVQYGRASAQEAMSKFSSFYFEHLFDETKLYPGILDVLYEFQFLPKVILTNKSTQYLAPLLKGLKLAEFFLEAFGRESFSTRKPDPGPLVQISRIYSVPLSQMIMIGDTEVDILAGKAAGTMTCAANYGYGEVDKISKMSPTYSVQKAIEMISLFRATPSIG